MPRASHGPIRAFARGSPDMPSKKTSINWHPKGFVKPSIRVQGLGLGSPDQDFVEQVFLLA